MDISQNSQGILVSVESKHYLHSMNNVFTYLQMDDQVGVMEETVGVVPPYHYCCLDACLDCCHKVPEREGGGVILKH